MSNSPAGRDVRSPRTVPTRSTSVSIALLALAITTLVPAGSAAAKSPPRGTYTCTKGYGYYDYAGTLKILRDNRYRVNGGRIGRFAMSGRVITWKTGVYQGLWRSRTRLAAGADRTLTIGHFFRNDRDFSDEQVSCYRDD